MADAQQTANLEQELSRLLEIERFDPPEQFVRDALISDVSVHEAAAADPVGWWERQAEALHWFERWDTALD
ncbi:MAG TPA: acetyl-coenzyme A synthetase N-terminal domain-containing protein, partial [Solirubrobacteraceae bacterium]|nr:acetyl-coenzyme A synthetase N-terminal domain-containing protein [Solirubrobacteraceae bacterium]